MRHLNVIEKSIIKALRSAGYDLTEEALIGSLTRYKPRTVLRWAYHLVMKGYLTSRKGDDGTRTIYKFFLTR